MYYIKLYLNGEFGLALKISSFIKLYSIFFNVSVNYLNFIYVYGIC